jgi:probable addiction module antidote protein
MPVKTIKFAMADHLKTAKQQIAYIEAALDEDDPSFIAVAIGDVAKVRGVSQFARDTGLSRETIYKSFRAGGNPTIDSVNKALRVLGLRLTLTKAKAA